MNDGGATNPNPSSAMPPMPSVRTGPSQLGFFAGSGAGGGVGSAALGGTANNFGAGGGQVIS